MVSRQVHYGNFHYPYYVNFFMFFSFLVEPGAACLALLIYPQFMHREDPVYPQALVSYSQFSTGFSTFYFWSIFIDPQLKLSQRRAPFSKNARSPVQNGQQNIDHVRLLKSFPQTWLKHAQMPPGN